MPDEFDFYATPNPSEEGEGQDYIDLPLTRAKSITRNRTLTFFILVVFSLGLSLWLLFSADWKAYWAKREARVAEAVAEEKRELESEAVEQEPDAAVAQSESEPRDRSLVEQQPNDIELDETINASQLTLFPGTHKIAFRPDTAKEEGLSLFYVTGKKDVPASDVFEFEESKVRLSKSSDDLLTKADETMETELEPIEMFIRVGKRQLELGDQNQALAAFTRVLALNPDHKEALELSSMVYAELEQFDKAELLLERLADLEPKNAEVRNNLAVIFLRGHRELEAFTQLEMALDVDPDYLDAKINMSLVLLSRGEFRKVEELIAPHFSQGMRDPSILNILAKASAGQGKEGASRTYLEQLIEVEPQPEYYYTMARSYLLGGESSRALQWLYRGKNKYPAGEFAAYLKDPVFEDLKGKPGAKRLFAEEAPNP